MTTEWMTVKEAADCIGCSMGSINQWIKRGVFSEVSYDYLSEFSGRKSRTVLVSEVLKIKETWKPRQSPMETIKTPAVKDKKKDILKKIDTAKLREQINALVDSIIQIEEVLNELEES